MKHRIEQKIANMVISHSNITEEHLIKDVAHKFISDLSLEDLKKLFKIRILGDKKSFEEAITRRDEYEIDLIQDLMRSDTSLICGEIEIE